MDDLQSLFTTDLTNVDISRPVLKQGPTAFVVHEMKIVDTRDHTKKMLNIFLKTRFEQVSTKDEKLSPGFTLTDRVVLTPTEERTAERVMQDLKRFQLACGRTGPFGSPDSYVGSHLTANVTIESDATGTYGDQNRVRYIAADKA